MNLDEFGSYVREQMSKYIGRENSEEMRAELAADIVATLGEFIKRDWNVWASRIPQVGDMVEARRIDCGLLEPEDLSAPVFDSSSSIRLIYMMPGNPLLVLATSGREAGMLRVASMWSGDTGWMHVDCLRPFDP